MAKRRTLNPTMRIGAQITVAPRPDWTTNIPQLAEHEMPVIRTSHRSSWRYFSSLSPGRRDAGLSHCQKTTIQKVTALMRCPGNFLRM